MTPAGDYGLCVWHVPSWSAGFAGGLRPGYILCAALQGIATLEGLSSGPTTLSEGIVVLRRVENGFSVRSRLGGTCIFVFMPEATLQRDVYERTGNRCDPFGGFSLTMVSPRSAPRKALLDHLRSAAAELARECRVGYESGASMVQCCLALVVDELTRPCKLDEGAAKLEPPRYVTIVERYFAENPSMDLSIAQLARLAGVSPRTLHDGFRKYRKCSPKARLREHRMLAIRKELTAPRADTSVTDAALNWGFNHLGRFSEYYARRFGEKPSETLQKARRFDPSQPCAHAGLT